MPTTSKNIGQPDETREFDKGKVHVLRVGDVEFGPGDLAVIPAGHDAWVVGNDPVVAFDFSPGISGYAKG